MPNQQNNLRRLGLLQQQAQPERFEGLLSERRTQHGRRKPDPRTAGGGLIGSRAQSAAAIGGGFLPGAGLLDTQGLLAKPGGGFYPSLRENLNEGNYLDAAFQGLGFTGDLASFGGPIGVGLGAVLKAPGQIRRAHRAARAAEDLLSSTRSDAPLPGLLGDTPPATRPVEERIDRYLNDEEHEILTENDMPQIESLLNVGASPEEVASMAAAGGAKRGWYRESTAAIDQVFGQDADRFTALLAALSPQTSVESNLRNSLNVWKNWTLAGRPGDEASILRILGESVEGAAQNPVVGGSVLPAWENNVLRALRTTDEQYDFGRVDQGITRLSGPKVNSFMRNLIGGMDDVTQDTWMARSLGFRQSPDFEGRNLVAFQDEAGRQGVQKPGYFAGNILVREAAEIMTARTGQVWTPAEIQETVWSWTKAIWEQADAAGETRTIPQILQGGGVSDNLILETPDFGTMFREQGEFHDILKDAGYGEQLTGLQATDSGFGTRGAISLGAEGDRSLVSAAERLQRTARSRGTGSAEDVRQLVTGQFPLRSPGTSGASQSVSGRFRRRAGQTGTGLLEQPSTQYFLPKSDQGQFNKLNIDTPPIHEITNPQSFHDSISTAKANHDFGPAVEVKSVEEYENMRMFVTRDGTAGFAIAPDGDIVSVFNDIEGPHRGVTPYMLSLAREQGGTKLDAFDIGGGLPDLYNMSGFDEVGRSPWDNAFAPADWTPDTLGTPDIVFMEAR